MKAYEYMTHKKEREGLKEVSKGPRKECRYRGALPKLMSYTPLREGKFHTSRKENLERHRSSSLSLPHLLRPYSY